MNMIYKSMSESQLDILIDQMEEVSQKLDKLRNAIKEIELPKIPDKVSVLGIEEIAALIQKTVNEIELKIQKLNEAIEKYDKNDKGRLNNNK